MTGAATTLDDVLADVPPPLEVPDATARIRAARAAGGRRTVALDDDPTGSQSVHGVQVVLALEPGSYAAALEEPGSTAFLLTNTRSLDEADARSLTATVARDVLALGESVGAPVDLVSRSDSTLRGHVHAEVAELDAALRAHDGAGADAVLFVPAYLEAGRVTAGGTHWARVSGEWLPVGESEFAADATFGYSCSDLRDFLAERSDGSVSADDVALLDLTTIRGGGVEAVADAILAVTDGGWVAVDAVEQSDLEVVALAALAAQERGHRLLFRTGPSFVRALAGIDVRDPLGAGELAALGPSGRHGLVVVGSHTALTSRQVDALVDLGGVERVELDVAVLADPERRDDHVARAVERAGAAMEGSDVLLITSRDLVRGDDGASSLAIARATSAAVVEVVAALRERRPGWVVAKGGITSHDVAVAGLGIERAEVVGQLLPGAVSVLRPLQAPQEVTDVPYVVFAGNVGDDGSLAAAVTALRGQG